MKRRYKVGRKYKGMGRTRGGAWIVPKDQVQEFLSPGPIDYDTLILDCYPEQEREKIKRKMVAHNLTFKCKDLKEVRLKDVMIRKGSI